MCWASRWWEIWGRDKRLRLVPPPSLTGACNIASFIATDLNINNQNREAKRWLEEF
jgi:hypothetical protein